MPCERQSDRSSPKAPDDSPAPVRGRRPYPGFPFIGRTRARTVAHSSRAGPLDICSLSANHPTYRATRVAFDVIERTVQTASRIDANRGVCGVLGVTDGTSNWLHIGNP